MPFCGTARNSEWRRKESVKLNSATLEIKCADRNGLHMYLTIAARPSPIPTKYAPTVMSPVSRV
jgi:hypothetical protein